MPAQHRHSTVSAQAQHQLSTGSAPAQHWLGTSSALTLHQLSTGGGVASWLRRGLTYPRSWIRATPVHIFLCLQISLISAPSCRVPCPDGIKLQSLGNVRFRNWRREVGKMAIATTSSCKLSDHRKGHVAIGNTHTHF